MDNKGNISVNRPIGNDIRLLGGLLGQTLISQEGEDHFELEEQIRILAKKRREGDAQASSKLDELLRGISEDSSATRTILKAFTSWFYLVNLAEVRQRVRTLRDRQRSAEETGVAMDETILAGIRGLRDRGLTADQVQEILMNLCVSPVLTAHPTESQRRTILDIRRTIDSFLAKLEQSGLLPSEKNRIEQQIHDQIVLLWQSDETRRRRPTVMDEVRNNGMYYFENTLFEVVPEIYNRLESALQDCWPDHKFEIPVFLHYGSWIGGDRDGNPYVTNSVTEETLREQKETILKQYNTEVDHLYHRLSPSIRRVSVSQELLESINNDMALAPEDEHDVLHRFDEEPYRMKMILIFRRLRATRALNDKGWEHGDEDPRAYASPDDLLRDLEIVRDSLVSNLGSQLVDRGLNRLIRQVKVFGFHLVSLEIRQHSGRYGAAVSEILGRYGVDFADKSSSEQQVILDKEIQSTRPLTAQLDFEEETNETVSMMRLVSRSQQFLGPRSIQTCIISMTTSAVNVLEVLVLATDAGLFGKIDIVPLFETVEDLEAAPQIMQALFDDQVYKDHLAARGNSQQIMIGYSDSNKDGGFLQANWMLYQAQKKLADVCSRNEIKLTLFHGRGGSIGRGGGPANRAILAQPPESVAGRIKITEQGEVISNRYSNSVIANRHLEQLISAVLLTSVPREEPEEAELWSTIMNQTAAAALTKYRSLVTRPEFIHFFNTATPIQFVDFLNLGSRPARRKQTETINDLRAIPWVFAWTQSRMFLPSWYGTGTGIESWLAHDQNDIRTFQEMYRRWPLVQTLVNNLHLEMARADLETGKRYSELAGEKGRDIFEDISEEFERTRRIVLEITGHERLLDTEPWLRESIDKRNPYVDPLNWLQVILNKKFADGAMDDDPDLLRQTILLSVSGLAAGLQSVG